MRPCVRASTAIAFLLFAAGCTSGGAPSAPSATASTTPAPSAPSSFSDKLKNVFTGSPGKSQSVAGAPADVECPALDIRQGAATLQIPPPNGENGTMALKYQGTFLRAARQCSLVNNQMVMKIGVEGRLIVGPAGGPGQVDVPLRIAVVQETPAATKPIVTKFVRLSVNVPPGSDGMNFTHVEDAMTFPMPSAADFDSYIVYIGFDPLTAEAEDKAKVAPRPKPKPKAKPLAGTG